MSKWQLREIDKKKYTNYWYGLLPPFEYNKKILNTLNHHQLLDLDLLIGLEFEFYIKDKISFFRELREIIPHTQQVLVNTDVCLNGNLETWVFTSDDSLISGKKGFVGVELISPLMDYKLGIYYIQVILKLLNSENTYADKTCGLHIHISEPNNIKVLTPKNAILLAEYYDLFSWKPRNHSHNIYSEIFHYEEPFWKLIYNKVVKRCYGLNLFYIKEHNHIEYKSIGGKNYFKKEEKIIKNFIDLIKIFNHKKNKPILKSIKKKLKSKKKKSVIFPSALSISEFKIKLLDDDVIL